jgi:iduronate 2-sulfatase
MRGWKTLRTERYRYVLESDGSEQLYDLQADPNAYRDLKADLSQRETLAQLRHQLLVHQLDSERPRPRSWPY